jgi:hypothetical protein
VPTGTVTISSSIGGVTTASTVTRTDDGVVAEQVTLPAAPAGTLSTRTDNDTGVVTLSGGHGVTTGTVNVFWSTGARYGMTGTVATNDVTVDAGAGDNLPAQATAVYCVNQTEIDCDFDGDDASLIYVHASKRAHAHFQTAASASLLALPLAENESFTWASGQGVTVPITGNPCDKILASAGGADAAVLTVGIIKNSV